MHFCGTQCVLQNYVLQSITYLAYYESARFDWRQALLVVWPTLSMLKFFMKQELFPKIIIPLESTK